MLGLHPSLRLAAALALAWALAGCAGQPRFDSPADYLGGAAASIEATARSVEARREAGAITDAEARVLAVRLGEALDRVRVGNQALQAGERGGALAAARLVRSALAEIERYLLEQANPDAAA